MVVRRLASPEVAHPYRTQVKVAHRADPAVVVPQGAHDAVGEALLLLREWFPFEVLHFPIRSRDQLERKYSVAAYERGGRIPRHTEEMESSLQDDFEATYTGLLVDDVELGRGLGQGSLFMDTRLRDALHGASGSDSELPSLLDDVELAGEIDTFLETDAARRLETRASSLEARLASVEASDRRSAYRPLTRQADEAVRSRRYDPGRGAENRDDAAPRYRRARVASHNPPRRTFSTPSRKASDGDRGGDAPPEARAPRALAR